MSQATFFIVTFHLYIKISKSFCSWASTSLNIRFPSKHQLSLMSKTTTWYLQLLCNLQLNYQNSESIHYLSWSARLQIVASAIWLYNRSSTDAYSALVPAVLKKAFLFGRQIIKYRVSSCMTVSLQTQYSAVSPISLHKFLSAWAHAHLCFTTDRTALHLVQKDTICTDPSQMGPSAIGIV